MLARSADRLPRGRALRGGCVYEPKWDGYRALVFATEDGARVQSRRGADLTPRSSPRVDGLDVATRYLSASEDSFVGGDLYDCSLTEGYTRFIVGDVRGKGIAAVEQAARVIRAERRFL